MEVVSKHLHMTLFADCCYCFKVVAAHKYIAASLTMVPFILISVVFMVSFKLWLICGCLSYIMLQ